MSDVLTALEIILLLVVLWFSIKKFDLSGYHKGLLSLTEFILLVAGVLSLGLLVGTLIFFGANILLAVALSIKLAFQEDDLLAHAAAVSGSTKEELKWLVKRLRWEHQVFHYIRPVARVQLIDHLCQRARNVAEIEAMAPAIAMLWVMERPELGKFVADFDRLLRLWRKPASEAMSVADTIASMGQHSPMNTQEAIVSLIKAAEGLELRDHSADATVETEVA